MSSLFQKALKDVLRHEGGWADHPADRGGKTNMGITIGVFRGLGRESDLDGDGDVDGEDLRALTREGAERIYRTRYWTWDRGDADGVPDRVKAKHFNVAVNCGVRAANILLQRAVNRVRGRFLAEDGVIGPKTLAGIAGCDEGHLLVALCAVQLDRYKAIVASNPSQEVFLRGWTKRALYVPSV